MSQNKKKKHAFSKKGPHLWQITAVRDLMWLGLAVILGCFIYYLRGILLPLFLGLLLAYLFYPAINFANVRLRIPRPVTVIIILALSLAGMAIVSLWLLPPLVEQGVDFVQSLPEYLEALRDDYGVPIGDIPQKPGEILEKFDVESKTILPFIGNVIGTSLLVLLWIIILPVSFFVFSLNFGKLVQKIKGYIPSSRRKKILHILQRMDSAVGSFFRGRLLISLIISLMFSAGWFLAGVPYWFLLGVATGLMSTVPYLSTLGWIAAVLVKYLEMTMGAPISGFDWLAVVVWPTVVYQGVNVIEEYVLTPWIQSKSTKLHPLTILMVVFIGGFIGGLWGLLFAIPVAACFKILWEEVAFPRLESRVHES
jgi:predicted PurR-regulated permease PerM